MDQLLKLVLLVGLLVGLQPAANAKTLKTAREGVKTESVSYSDRLAGLDLPLTAPMNRQLKRKIGQYVKQGGSSTELMLGRAELYFPVFEYYLDKYDLPESLKYLPVAESLLRSRAVSSASAAGLWQLMPGTARAYGLRVDNVVDERLNIHLATETAAKILTELHEQFGDWNLVLAAYNAGGGRVRKALRQSRSRDYAVVQRYLPRETQQYVSAYLAAAYAVNFYNDHGLSPRFSSLHEQPLEYIRVYREVSFRKMAKVTGMNYRDLRRLNPAFRRGYIPKNRKGYFFCVPRNVRLVAYRELNSYDNLVEINRPEVSPLAYQFATDSGYDPYFWLYGVRQTDLLENNDLATIEPIADAMVNDFFLQDRILAAHP